MHDEIDLWWDSRWADTRPVGHHLRLIHPERWVRFHSLPESKQYPDSEDEFEIVMARHHAVLADLGLTGRCFGVATRYTGDSIVGSWPYDVALPDAFLWRVEEEEEDLQVEIYAAELWYPSSQVDHLLRAVADDEEFGVILIPAFGDWLYHPYTGGADVIAASVGHRDDLACRFADWLSSHPEGL